MSPYKSHCPMGHVRIGRANVPGCQTCAEIELREFEQWQAEKHALMPAEMAAIRARTPDVLKIQIVDTGEIKRFAIPRGLRRRAA